MATYYYSDERNVQLLVALLKARGIRYVVASPGTTNINFVWSVQYDSFFKVFSAVDERHAAYLACGIATETNEPVVLSCTGATASRNYFPALTEAYYRKLPILAVTSRLPLTDVGNLVAQVLDRSTPPRDTVVYSTQCDIPTTDGAARACELTLNKALIALTRHGGGPVHIDLETHYSRTFSTQQLPPARVIQHVMPTATSWPTLPENKRIAIWVGAHRRFTPEEQSALEAFVLSHNAIVLTDKTSNYTGAGRIEAAFLCSQKRRAMPELSALVPEFIIHLGEVSGDYPTTGMLGGPCRRLARERRRRAPRHPGAPHRGL